MAAFVTRCPDHDNEASTQKSDRHETRLTLITAIIATGILPPGNDQLGIGEIQATLGERPLALGLVAAVRHLMYPQKPGDQVKL